MEICCLGIGLDPAKMVLLTSLSALRRSDVADDCVGTLPRRTNGPD